VECHSRGRINWKVRSKICGNNRNEKGDEENKGGKTGFLEWTLSKTSLMSKATREKTCAPSFTSRGRKARREKTKKREEKGKGG